MGMCVYLRFKFVGRLLVCVRVWPELVTEVYTAEQVVTELRAVCRCLLVLLYRILHWCLIVHLSFIWLLISVFVNVEYFYCIQHFAFTLSVL